MKLKKLLIIIVLTALTFGSICYAETKKAKTASATVGGETLSFKIGDGISLDMVYCPSGSFIMGCSSEEYVNDYYLKFCTGQHYSPSKRKLVSFSEFHKEWFGFEYNEKPHKVTISKPFYIGKYEVTQSQFECIFGEKLLDFTGANKPVVNVTYEYLTLGREKPLTKRTRSVENGKIVFKTEVIASATQGFLTKINSLLEKQIPPGYKFDLPTEAQWEYACKAGTKKDFISNIDDVAWYGKNSGGATHDVGKKKPNAWVYRRLG